MEDENKLKQLVEYIKVTAPIKIVDDNTAKVMAEIITTNLVNGIENLKRVTGSSAKSIQLLNEKLDSYIQKVKSEENQKAIRNVGLNLAQAMGLKAAQKPVVQPKPVVQVAKPVVLKPNNLHVMVKTHPDPKVKQPTGLYKVQELVVEGDKVQVKIHGNRGWVLDSRGAIPLFLDFYKNYRTNKTKMTSMYDVIRNAV
jgi:hypothetical protein